MTQLVKFPDKEWAKLATIAERRGMTIAELLVETARVVFSGKRPELAPADVPEPVTPRAPKVKRQVSPIVDTDNPEIAQRIRDLRAQNWSLVKIAAEMGVTRDAMRGAFKRLGLASSRTGRPSIEVDLDRVAALHGQNRSDGEIARELDVTYAVVYRARRFQLHLPPVGKSGRKSTTQQREEAA